jgi:hypothetical protein
LPGTPFSFPARGEKQKRISQLLAVKPAIIPWFEKIIKVENGRPATPFGGVGQSGSGDFYN